MNLNQDVHTTQHINTVPMGIKIQRVALFLLCLNAIAEDANSVGHAQLAEAYSRFVELGNCKEHTKYEHIKESVELFIWSEFMPVFLLKTAKTLPKNFDTPQFINGLVDKVATIYVNKLEEQTIVLVVLANKINLN